MTWLFGVEGEDGKALSRPLLRRAAELAWGWRELPELARSGRGKPYFPQRPGRWFSLSHSGGLALCALSDDGPVGADIEHIRPVSQRAMRRLADVATERAFFESWVRREARAKRSGAGVGTMLSSEEPLSQGEQFYLLDTFPGYVAGVATRGGGPPGQVKLYSMKEFTSYESKE